MYVMLQGALFVYISGAFSFRTYCESRRCKLINEQRAQSSGRTHWNRGFGTAPSILLGRNGSWNLLISARLWQSSSTHAASWMEFFFWMNISPFTTDLPSSTVWSLCILSSDINLYVNAWTYTYIRIVILGQHFCTSSVEHQARWVFIRQVKYSLSRFPSRNALRRRQKRIQLDDDCGHN